MYKLYPFYIIMYDIGISFTFTFAVYGAIAKPTKSDSSKVVGSNMCEYVLREVGKLFTQTNEDGMVRRGDPWGSGTGTTRAVDPFSTLQSVLEWAAFLFAVSSDHEDQ